MPAFVDFRPDLSPTRQIGCDMNNTMTTHRNHFDGCAKVNAPFLLHRLFHVLVSKLILLGRGLKSKVDENRLLLLEDGPRKPSYTVV